MKALALLVARLVPCCQWSLLLMKRNCAGQHWDSASKQLLAVQMKKPATKWCGLSCMWSAGRQMHEDVKNTDLLT